MISLDVSFETIDPGCCDQIFAVPRAQCQSWRREHSTWHCPGCGSQRHFGGESDLERLERQAKYAEEARRSANRRHESERRSHTATKGHLTRSKKRHAAGVCPCCKRTFKQLVSHMNKKHPGYSPSDRSQS